MIEVVPAVLEKEFGEIEKKIKLIDGLTDWIQIDFADGKLVPNTTFSDSSAFKNLKTKSKLEAHLMVSDPVTFVKPLYNGGFRRFYAQVEAGKTEDYMAECYKYDCEIGLAIDGPTDFEKIHPYLDNIDIVLVMAIEMGFSGRPYREDTGERIARIREIDINLPIAVDGAMNDVNARKAVAAGANIICSNSYIFSGNIKERIDILSHLDQSGV